MSISRPTRLALLALLTVSSAALAQSSSLMAELTWESGNLNGTKQVRVNVPVVTTERARAGKYSMKATLRADGASKTGGERNEIQISNSNAPMNTSVWYGFSVFLPSDHVDDKVWEIVTQWFAYADDDTEWVRQPTMSLQTHNGAWVIGNKSSSVAITHIDHPSISSRAWNFGPIEKNKWTDWVFNVKWTHNTDGFLKIWKDGKQVLDYKGPTSYNDKQGPFVKQGIYKGWQQMGVDKATVRTIYHDEFRMAGPNGSYEMVAPGGGKPAAVAKRIPTPPTGLVIQ
jgi:hypothetical protein